MRRVVAIPLVLLALAASSCSGSRPSIEDGAEREVAVAADDASDRRDEPVVLRLGVGVPWSRDPADAGPASVITRVLADLLHEGLTRLDDDDRPEPALAERWFVSDDRLTWTFVLPPSLVAGDGEPLVARDIMRSLDHVAARGPSDQAAVSLMAVTGWSDRMAGDSGGVAGLSAPDDQTLVIHLDRPFELLIDVLAAPAFGVLALTSDAEVRTTGAYRYGASDDVLIAVDPDAAVDRIELVDATGDVGAELFESGAVDWAVLAAGSGPDDLPGDIIRQPLEIRVGIAVRLADLAERHGVLAAIDPLALTTGVLAFAPLPSPLIEAERALPASVPVEIPAGRLRLVADALAGQLESAGIEVDRIESDTAAFALRVSSGDALVFPVVLAGGTDAVVSLLQAFSPGGVDDVFGIESEVRTSLALAIEAEQDPDQRALFVAALEASLLEDGLLRMVGQLEVRLAVGPSLTGLTHNADGTLVLGDVVESVSDDSVDARG